MAKTTQKLAGKQTNKNASRCLKPRRVCEWRMAVALVVALAVALVVALGVISRSHKVTNQSCHISKASS
jgi:hypothetical protein